MLCVREKECSVLGRMENQNALWCYFIRFLRRILRQIPGKIYFDNLLAKHWSFCYRGLLLKVLLWKQGYYCVYFCFFVKTQQILCRATPLDSFMFTTTRLAQQMLTNRWCNTECLMNVMQSPILTVRRSWQQHRQDQSTIMDGTGFWLFVDRDNSIDEIKVQLLMGRIFRSLNKAC